MAPTVAEQRNEIRVAVGRYKRKVSSGFTKEALAAICDSLDADVEIDVLPKKGVMRAAIAEEVEGVDGSRDQGSAFRKAELTAITAAVSSD
ncbi:hypothetical protein [Halolamina salifodinae]|uniref:Uncharacterized protein n=1 Tax=Halolamina salifodinae TaxID=1202767 RepID=A0A8T4H0M8_9EURY|nr:hypothetical protein [Halolamina salifodinae]MBP1987344.1 hypothetical protein [Halolamina salifodinae]